MNSVDLDDPAFLKQAPISTAYLHMFNSIGIHKTVGLLGGVLLNRIAVGESAFGVVSISDAELCRQLDCDIESLHQARERCVQAGLLDLCPGEPCLYRLLVPTDARGVFWSNVQEQLSRVPR